MKKKSEIFLKKLLTFWENMKDFKHNQKGAMIKARGLIDKTQKKLKPVGARKNLKPLKNMNISSKNDKDNIQKIEDLRARLVDEEKGRGGLALYIDSRAVEIFVEREESFEQVRARLIDLQYVETRRQVESVYFDVAKIVSDYLTTAEIYNVIKAGVNSYIERGF